MRVQQFETALIDKLRAADHPEIVGVSSASEGDPSAHTRAKVEFASGAKAFVMVADVQGEGISRHSTYDLPKEAL